MLLVSRLAVTRIPSQLRRVRGLTYGDRGLASLNAGEIILVYLMLTRCSPSLPLLKCMVRIPRADSGQLVASPRCSKIIRHPDPFSETVSKPSSRIPSASKSRYRGYRSSAHKLVLPCTARHPFAMRIPMKSRCGCGSWITLGELNHHAPDTMIMSLRLPSLLVQLVQFLFLPSRSCCRGRMGASRRPEAPANISYPQYRAPSLVITTRLKREIMCTP